jgi:hypothetical protein
MEECCIFSSQRILRDLNQAIPNIATAGSKSLSWPPISCPKNQKFFIPKTGLLSQNMVKSQYVDSHALAVRNVNFFDPEEFRDSSTATTENKYDLERSCFISHIEWAFGHSTSHNVVQVFACIEPTAMERSHQCQLYSHMWC